MFEELRDKLLKVYMDSYAKGSGVSFSEWLQNQERSRGDGDWYEEAYVFLRYIGGDYGQS